MLIHELMCPHVGFVAGSALEQARQPPRGDASNHSLTLPRQSAEGSVHRRPVADRLDGAMGYCVPGLRVSPSARFMV